MFSRKALSNGLFSRRGFLFNKKLMAFFIFASLSINGFTPSAMEVSKYSFVMTVYSITQNIAMQIFEKCDIAIADLASDVYFDFFSDFERKSGERNNGKSAEKKRDFPKNGVEGIEIKQIIFNKKIEVFKDKNILLCVRDIVLYEEQAVNFIKSNNIFSSGIIIMFLIFIAAILQRKKLNNTVNKINIYRKAISV